MTSIFSDSEVPSVSNKHIYRYKIFAADNILFKDKSYIHPN